MKRFYRWLATLLAVGLIAGLIYLLIPPRQPVTYLLAVTNTNYVEHVVPPIPFVLEDVRVLEALTDLRPTLVMADHFREPNAAELGAVAAGLSGQTLDENDVLIVYISGHGVAVDGNPYLLCSDDFRWNQTATDMPRGGMVAVTDLLKQMQSLPTKLKLLVLDTGWLTADPRLGMLVNEFPILVQQMVYAAEDPSLWVLLSSSTFERCHAATSQQHTVFGRCFVGALEGSADQDHDLRLSLAELYGYLRSGCRTSMQTAGQVGQTPLLLRGSKGLVQLGDTSLTEHFVAATPPIEEQQEGQMSADGETPVDGSTTEDRSRTSRDAATRRIRGRAAQRLPSSVRRAAAVVPAASQPARSDDGGAPTGDATTEREVAQPESAADARPSGHAATPTDGDRATAAEGAAGNPPAALEGPIADQPARDPAGPPPPPRPADRGTPPPASQAAPSADATLPHLRRSLYKAWRLRDELASIGIAEPGHSAILRQNWSPVDVAPDLWRGLCARLLAYEQLCRGGATRAVEHANWNAEKVATDLDQIVRGLSNLAADMQRPGSTAEPHDHWVTDSLWTAWHHAGGGEDPLATPGQADTLVGTMRLLNDMLFLTPHYVRWHGRASLGSTVPLPQTGPLIELLRQLEQLANRIATIDRLPLTAADEKLVAGDRAAIVSAWRTLEMSLEQARTTALDQLSRGIEGPVVDQLDTLYLSAGDRQRLLDRLLDSNRSGPPLPESESAEWRLDDEIDLALATGQRQTVQRQLRMHCSLIRLAYGADSDRAKAIEAICDTLGQSGREGGDSAESDRAFWMACRQAGRTLEQDYATLGRKAFDQLIRSPELAEPASASQHWQHVWRLLCLADPRDIPSSRPQRPVDVYALMGVLPKVDIAISPPQHVTVDAAEWQPVTAAISTQVLTNTGADSAGTAQLQLDFDADLIEVRPAETNRLLAPGQLHHMTLGADGTVSVGYLVRYRPSRGWQGTTATKLEISVLGPEGQSDQAAIRCFPNEVKVSVVRVVGGGEIKDQAVGPRIELRPFPNRSSQFLFRMQNRTGVARAVDVQLVAVPVPIRPTRPPGRLVDESGARLPGVEQAVFDAAGQLRAGIAVVAQTAQPVALPADGAQQIPIEFAPPGEAKPQARPPATATGDTQPVEAAPAATAAEPIVTYGLVVVLRDHAGEDQPTRPWEWRQWIEITPLSPRSYVDAMCQCDGQGKVTMIAQLRAGPSDRPADWESVPISLECHLDRPSVAPPTGLLSASIEAPQERATTWVVASTNRNNRRPVTVHLNVDHYPRAFTYEVRPWQQLRAHEVPDTRPYLPRIRIKQLGRSDAAHVFRPPDLATFRPADDPIRISMETDAPLNAFQQLDVSPPPDSVELAIQYADGTSRRLDTLYADRAVETRLAKTEPGGRLTLRTTVTDYQQPIDTLGPRNERFTIRTDLRLQGDVVKTSAMEAIVDDQPPRLRILAADVAAPTSGDGASNKILRVQLEAQDRSGIEDAQILFDFQRVGQSDKPKPLVPILISPPTNDDVRLVDLDVEPFDPGQYLLTARAIDRASNQGTSPSFQVVLRQRQAPTKPQPKNGVVRGRVRKGSFYADGVTVTLKAAGLPDRQTENGGQFLFRDVPPGQYTIVAQGPVLGITHQGQLDNVQPTPAGQPPKMWTVELVRIKK